MSVVGYKQKAQSDQVTGRLWTHVRFPLLRCCYYKVAKTAGNTASLYTVIGCNHNEQLPVRHSINASNFRI